MTLSDVLEPSMTVIGHAKLKGLQLGAGICAVAAIPTLWISPDTVNPSNEPPLVAVARCAGMGAVAGATVLGVHAVVKLSQCDAPAIRDRAVRLRDNQAQARIDSASAAGAGIGLALVAVRVQKIAEAEGVSIGDVALTKAGGWEMFCFAALGAAVGAGVAVLVKGSVKLVEEKGGEVRERVREGANKVENKAERAGQEIKEGGEEVKERAQDAVGTAENKADEAMSEAKGAIHDATAE